MIEFCPPLSLEPEAGDSTPQGGRTEWGATVWVAEAPPPLHENVRLLSVVPGDCPLLCPCHYFYRVAL